MAFGKQLDPQNKVKAIAKTTLGIVTTPIIPQNQNASTSDVLESDLGDRSTSFDEGRDETNSNDSETTTNTHIPPSLSDVDITTQVGSFPENIIFDVEEENPKATASESYPFLSAYQEAQRQGRSPKRAKAPKKRVTFTDQKSEIEPEFKMKNDKIKATVTQSSNPTKTNDLNRADVVSFDPTAYLYKRDSNKIANLVRMRVRSIPERKKVIEQWHNKYEEGLMKMSWYRHIKS